MSNNNQYQKKGRLAVEMAQLVKVPEDLISKFSLLIYSDPVYAAFKGMGLE